MNQVKQLSQDGGNVEGPKHAVLFNSPRTQLIEDWSSRSQSSNPLFNFRLSLIEAGRGISWRSRIT